MNKRMVQVFQCAFFLERFRLKLKLRRVEWSERFEVGCLYVRRKKMVTEFLMVYGSIYNKFWYFMFVLLYNKD